MEERCMRGNFSALLYLLSRATFSARRCGPIFGEPEMSSLWLCWTSISFQLLFMGSCSLSVTIMFAFIRFMKVVDGSRN